ncbi:MAG: hypothetical protein ACYC26_00535 [Phycisphaerales bacterium]
MEWFTLNRLLGVGLGIILGYAYVHYAWSKRSDDKGFIRDPKIRAILALTGQSGIFAVLAKYQWVSTESLLVSLAATFLTAAVWLLLLVFMASVAAFCSELKWRDGIRSAFVCATRALFQGHAAVEEYLKERRDELHNTSKKVLLQIIPQAYEAIATRNVPSDENFRYLFLATMGVSLGAFFQHHADHQNHPDFSAAYFVFDHRRNRLVQLQSFNLGSLFLSI